MYYKMTEESEIVEVVEEPVEVVEEPVEEDEDVPIHPLYVCWTENQWLTYRCTVSKWEDHADYNYLASHEPMMPFVYKLSFNEFLVQLESDKNSMSHQEVFEKYTGEKDCFN